MDKKIKVTLVKSTIGCTKKQIATVAALGLKKTNTSNIVPQNDCINGMLNIVSHLVKVVEA